MSSKRWLLTFFATALLVLGPLAAFNYWIDPDALWATETIPLRPIEGVCQYENRRVAWRKNGGEMLIMGSSRAVFLDWPRAIEGGRVQVLAFGDATLARQAAWWPKIIARGEAKRIYLGLDFLGVMRGWDDERSRLEDEWAPRMRSLFHYRRTRDSWLLLKRPDHWQASIDGVVDLRTGHMIWHRPERSARVDERSLDFFARRAQLIAADPGDAPARARTALDAMVAQAGAAGMEVVLFINPVANRYLEMLKTEGLWDDVVAWKADLVARHGAIDLMREWPEEMQGWFFDPAHLGFEYSAWMWEKLGIEATAQSKEVE